MITTNIIQRVFCACFPNNGGRGTCFTVEVDGKQYFITAKHLVGDTDKKPQLSIFHDEMWKPLPVKLVGHCDGDVSILSAGQQVSPTYPAEPTSGGMVYGQDAYFLGFPYLEIDPAFKEINNGYPQPFVKKGIVANMSPELLFLDGHNNPGFSGGPVVFNTPQSRDYKIAGVVSAYRATSQPVKEHEQDSSSITFDENAGIIVAYSINFAIDLIKSNSIGAPVNYGA